KYEADDYNCLHQDLYGDIHFPYQAAIMLSDENEYSGGEFTLVEQRPRMQSVAHVMNLKQGEAIIFTVNEFPKQGKKGYYRAKLRHGVSKLHSGNRHTLGIILHDAK
ncbi:MAG: proline hydroxylase, partial [Kordiimonadaceae bacterium]|nr:proline hydroxylase [Kordiimonadaceae bacterium]